MDTAPLALNQARTGHNGFADAIANAGLRATSDLLYFGVLWLSADVAELADALDSKSSIRKDVWVRPPPSAPLFLLSNADCGMTGFWMVG